MPDYRQMILRSLEETKIAFFRVARSNFAAEKATARERTQLAAAKAPITDPEVQDYAAWRRSLLLFSGLLLGVYLLIALASFESTEDALVEMFREQIQAAGQSASESEIRSNVRSFAPNLDVLDAPNGLHLLSLLVGVTLVGLAGRRWHDLRASCRMARAAWLTILGTSIVISVIPWVSMLEFSPAHQQEGEVMAGLLKLLMAMGVFLFLAPKLLAIFPGIVRTALTLKTLLPQSSLLAHAALLFLPVYALLLLVFFAALCQVGGDAKLLLGLLCLLAAVAVFFARAGALLRVQPAGDVAREVWKIRKTALAFNLAGMALFGWALMDLEFSVFDALNFLFSALGMLLLMMVMAADLFLVIIEKEQKRTQEFLASPDAPALESKVAALRAAMAGTAAAATAPEEVPEPD